MYTRIELTLPQQHWGTYKYKMQLTEIFDTSNIVWTSQEPDCCVCHFTVNGSEYYVAASQWERDEDLPERWDVEFGLIQPDGRGVHTNTNMGNSIAVFGKVVTALKQFFTKYSPTCITMGADGTRKQLYTKILRKFLPSWKITQQDNGIIAYKG